VIVLNFKAYAESGGEHALLLARIARESASLWNKPVFVWPAALDVQRVCHELPQFDNFRVLAQHCDANDEGAHTGSIPAQAVKKAGAYGTLVNHSEKKLKQLEGHVIAAKKADLYVIVCATTAKECGRAAKMKPDAVAFEPPDLIGSGISVTTRPEAAKKCISAIRKTKGVLALVGAGVSNAEDVAIAKRLGADGVLLASAYVKAHDHKAFLNKLLEAD